MIIDVTITNHLGEQNVLELRNPELSGFSVRGIEGLGPTKADINTTESLSIDGSLFNSARAVQRNIVFNLGFMEKPTIEEIRLKSYRMFPPKKRVDLVFRTDTRVSSTFGYVESNEPDIFSKEEGATISVICPNAYFYSNTPQVISFGSVVPRFEFPFSNESLTEPMLVFSEILEERRKEITYFGDASIGMVIRIHFFGPVTDPELFDVNTRESIKLDSNVIINQTGSGLQAGDDVIISTVKGNKSVILVRGTDIYNILNAVTDDSSWLEINPGINTFLYDAEFGVANMQFVIEHQTIYIGV